MIKEIDFENTKFKKSHVAGDIYKYFVQNGLWGLHVNVVTGIIIKVFDYNKMKTEIIGHEWVGHKMKKREEL